jgi:hypothetical protein
VVVSLFLVTCLLCDYTVHLNLTVSDLNTCVYPYHHKYVRHTLCNMNIGTVFTSKEYKSEETCKQAFIADNERTIKLHIRSFPRMRLYYYTFARITTDPVALLTGFFKRYRDARSSKLRGDTDAIPLTTVDSNTMEELQSGTIYIDARDELKIKYSKIHQYCTIKNDPNINYQHEPKPLTVSWDFALCVLNV